MHFTSMLEIDEILHSSCKDVINLKTKTKMIMTKVVMLKH